MLYAKDGQLTDDEMFSNGNFFHTFLPVLTFVKAVIQTKDHWSSLGRKVKIAAKEPHKYTAFGAPRVFVVLIPFFNLIKPGWMATL